MPSENSASTNRSLSCPHQRSLETVSSQAQYQFPLARRVSHLNKVPLQGKNLQCIGSLWRCQWAWDSEALHLIQCMVSAPPRYMLPGCLAIQMSSVGFTLSYSQQQNFLPFCHLENNGTLAYQGSIHCRVLRQLCMAAIPDSHAWRKHRETNEACVSQ